MNKSNLHNIFKPTECLSEGKLLRYVQNDLSNLERNEVEQHTINCKFCSEAIEGFETLNSTDNFLKFKRSFNASKTPFLKYFVGIAASILIVLLLVNQNTLEKPEYKTENSVKSQKVQRKDSSLVKEKDEVIVKNEVKKPLPSKKKSQEKSKSKLLERKEIIRKSQEKEKEIQSEKMLYNFDVKEDLKKDETRDDDIEIEEEGEPDVDQGGLYNASNNIHTDSLTVFRDESKKIKEEDSYSENNSMVEDDLDETLVSEKQRERAKKSMKNADKDGMGLNGIEISEEKATVSSAPVELKQDKVSEAKVKSDQKLNSRNTIVNTPLRKGKELIKVKQYEKAITSLSKIDSTDSDYYESLYLKADCYVQLNKKTKAKKIYNRLIKIDNPFKKKAEIELKKLNSKSE